MLRTNKIHLTNHREDGQAGHKKAKLLKLYMDIDIKDRLSDKKAFRIIRRKFIASSYTKIVAAGYFLLVMAGTFLLMLPFSSKTGQWTSFFDALTTATSASCVTGLIVFDTFTHWTVFGQLVILGLIQIGGLGYMTIITLLSVMIGRKIGLKERGLLKESTNSLQIGGLISLTKRVICGTVIFEVLGAFLLATRFIGVFGVKRGIYYGIFHSVSAFCNAGFDLLGAIDPYCSLTPFNSDPVVLITIMLLIFTGGIGFVVWSDVCRFRFKISRYKLHSKLAIVTSLFLIAGGALLIFILEYNNVLKDMSLGDKILNSFFASVTTRTAGFNSVACDQFTEATDLINIILMLIGGSSGSTAGGMKTTTFAVLLIAAWANIRNSKNINVFGRRLESDIIRKALTVAMIYSVFVFVSAIIIGFSNPELSLSDILFEIASAIGTVGLTCGTMGKVNLTGQIVLTLLMYCGRVGSMSFAMVFTEQKAPSTVMKPSEKIIIG